MRKFTLKELERCSGANGQSTYLAYQGKVYDVSGSPLWDGGIHQGQHCAGQDITAELPFAPHGEEVLKSFPLVGELAAEGTRGQAAT